MTGCVMPASSPRLEQRTASAHHKDVLLLREVLKLRNILGASLSVFVESAINSIADGVTSIVRGSRYVNTFCNYF